MTKKIMFSSLCCAMLFATDADIKQTQESNTPEEKTMTNEGGGDIATPKSQESFYNRNGFVIGVFGGGELLKTETEYEAVLGDYDLYDRRKFKFGPTYGARLGYDVYFLPEHGMRIYAEYIGSNFLSSDNIVGKVNTHTVTLNAEYKFEITKRFGIFAGINANYTFFQTEKFGRDEGFGVGVNAGFTCALTSWMELEFGVKYLGEGFKEKRHAPDSLAPTGLPINPTHQVTDIDTPINFRLGINFKI